MKLNAVSVTSKNILETIRFYTVLGFSFPEVTADEQHVESINPEQTVRLMIDSDEMIQNILGFSPSPSNHSQFAVEFESSAQVDVIAQKIQDEGFKIIKQPWDAFWGQRYCVVQDPDGYMIDLYAKL